MKNTTKKLLALFIIISISKIILSLLVTTPTIYSDEYIYIKMAQSFFQGLNFNIHNTPTSNYPPLYPILLSLTFLAGNVEYAYILMKILNSILTTAIIIPAYLIAKEFLEPKKAIIASVIITLLPMNFVFPAFIMSENLFYTLFLTSLYLIYKSFTEKNNKYDILAGLFIGLTFLTRFAGISLILIVIAALLYKLKKKEFFEIRKKIIMGLISLAVVSPWFIRNITLFGFSLRGILGQYSIEATKQVEHYSLNMFYWSALYISYLLLASLIIFSILNLSNIKNKLKENKMKMLTIITIITVLITVLGAAQHASKSAPKEDTNLPNLIGRPIGRYVDTALPLIMLFGIISYYKYKETQKSIKKVVLLSVPFILLSSQLLYFQLLPVNNISLTILGLANTILSKVLPKQITLAIITALLIVITFVLYTLTKNNKLNKVIPITALILILTSLAANSAITYNSKTYWQNHPQIELSRWMNNNIPEDAKILIDEDYCGNFNKLNQDVLCTKGKSTALTALWILNPVDINNINNKADYIITRKNLDMELIKKTENNIYLYKVS